MKRTAGLEFCEKLVINKEHLNLINNLVLEYCELVEYEAITLDGSHITFDGFEELVNYENYGEDKIKKLYIRGHNNYKSQSVNNISVQFPPRLTGIDSKAVMQSTYSLDTKDDEILFKKKMLDIMAKCRDGNDTFQKGRILSYVLLSLIDLMSFIAICKNCTVGTALFWLIILAGISALANKIFYRIWTSLFPPIVFSWGSEDKEESRRCQLRSNIIWGILMASIVSLVLTFITAFVT